VVHYIVCASLALAGIDSYYSSIDRRLERSREPLHPNCVYRQFSSWQVLAQDLVQVYVVGPGWPLTLILFSLSLWEFLFDAGAEAGL
jgi:hypothetical protein